MSINVVIKDVTNHVDNDSWLDEICPFHVIMRVTL